MESSARNEEHLNGEMLHDRRQGLAKTLMDLLEEVTQKVHDGFFVDLFVRQSNANAINMYKKVRPICLGLPILHSFMLMATLQALRLLKRDALWMCIVICLDQETSTAAFAKTAASRRLALALYFSHCSPAFDWELCLV